MLLVNEHAAQNVVINGKAHESYAGKVIELYTAKDYITNLKQKETQDTIQSDGYFELSFHTDITQPVYFKIENVVSQLYVQPNFVYGITFPELDQDKNLNKDVELQVNIGVIGTDSTELNALIFDYEEQYNKFFMQLDEKYLSRAILIKNADSLLRHCEKRYKNINNDYFKNHVLYSIAGLNSSLSRGEKFLMHNFILGKPIQYNIEAYMSFFNASFKGYLAQMASQRKGQSLYNIINTRSDYNTLLKFVNAEKDIKSDSLAELIILRELWDYYFSADFSSDAIVQIISQLNVNTKILEQKQISANMLAFFNKLLVGSPAPNFSAVSRDNKIADFYSLKGRYWVYLNFFSTKNIESLKEMPKIAAIKKKLGPKMIFVSVCLDDSISDYRNYLRSNPKFDWLILYNNNASFTKTAKDVYSVIGTEAYFLIDNFGHIAAAPALSPSKGIEYRLNVIFKVRERKTKTGIR